MTQHDGRTARDAVASYMARHPHACELTVRKIQPPPEFGFQAVEQLASYFTNPAAPMPVIPSRFSLHSYGVFTLLTRVAELPGGRTVGPALMQLALEGAALPESETGGELQYRHCLALRQLLELPRTLPEVARLVGNPANSDVLLVAVVEGIALNDLSQIHSWADKFQVAREILTRERVLGSRTRTSHADLQFKDAQRVDAVAARNDWRLRHESDAAKADKSPAFTIEQDDLRQGQIRVRPAFTLRRDDLNHVALQQDARTIGGTYTWSDAPGLPTPFVAQALHRAVTMASDPRISAWVVLAHVVPLPLRRLRKLHIATTQHGLFDESGNFPGDDDAPRLYAGSGCLAFAVEGLAKTSIDRWVFIRLGRTLVESLAHAVGEAPSTNWVARAARHFAEVQPYTTLGAARSVMSRWHTLHQTPLERTLLALLRGKLTSDARVALTYLRVPYRRIQLALANSADQLQRAMRMHCAEAGESLGRWLDIPTDGVTGAVGSCIDLSDQAICEAYAELRSALRRTRVPNANLTREPQLIVNRLNAARDLIVFDLMVTAAVRPPGPAATYSIDRLRDGTLALFARDKQTRTPGAPRIAILPGEVQRTHVEFLSDWIMGLDLLTVAGVRLGFDLGRRLYLIRRFVLGELSVAPLDFGDLEITPSGIAVQRPSQRDVWLAALARCGCNAFDQLPDNTLRHVSATWNQGVLLDVARSDLMGHSLGVGCGNSLSAIRLLGRQPPRLPPGRRAWVRLWRKYT